MNRQKPEYVVWSSVFSVGVKIVDDQHRGLFNLVNDMLGHITSDEISEKDYFKKVIYQVLQYIKVHFNTEEEIMIHTKFPGYAEHKKAHDAFVQIAVDTNRRFESGEKINLEDFTGFLKEWILTHIAIMDKQYFSYFKLIATRKTNGKLSINLDDVLAYSRK